MARPVGTPVEGLTVLYHGTPVENVPAILREGLVGQGSMMATGHGWVPAEPPTVHLGDGDWVLDHAQGMHGDEDEEMALLEVNVEGLDVTVGWDGEPAYAVLDRIEPHRIKRVR